MHRYRVMRVGRRLTVFYLSLLLLYCAVKVSAQDTKPEIAAPGEKKPITVISDAMDADREQRLVVFRGNVFAQEDFDLCSDVLHVYYDEADEIKGIIATGNVRIVGEDKRARGEKAVYDRGKKAVVITGNASAMQCEDVVEGEKITFYLDSDRMMVEGEEEKKGEEKKRVRATIKPKKECREGFEREEFKCRAPR